MQKITLSLEDTLFAKEHGAKWYNKEVMTPYKEIDGVLYLIGYLGGCWESAIDLEDIYSHPSMYEIDFSILGEQPVQEHDYKQLALQMAESVYNLSKTLDNLTLEEGIELQKALEAALIVLKETM